MRSEPTPSDADLIEELLQLIHQLSGPLSAMSLEVATIEELLAPRLQTGRDAETVELGAAVGGLKHGLDQSIDRFHAVRTQLLRERERRADAES